MKLALGFFWSNLFGVLIIGSSSWAHPVSFKGGYGVMPEYTPSRTDLEVNYSFSRNKAVGISGVWAETEDGDMTMFIPQFNYLAFRENNRDSQANIYLSLGLGGAEFKDNTDFVGMASIQADYETRRIYTLAHAQTIQSSGESELNHFRYRLGFAPYIAGYEGVHSWLIGQVDYSPEMEDEWSVTPMVRIFYDNYLFEAGVSLKGQPVLAFISHF